MRHAKEKFATLARHGVKISKRQVIEAVKNPVMIDKNRSPLHIAQKALNINHVLRVVYRKERERIVVITFYPGRKSQYEKK